MNIERATAISPERITDDTNILIVGAGIVGLSFALELSSLLPGDHRPHITIVDRVDDLTQTKICKGCAGGVLDKVFATLAEYDTTGITTFVNDQIEVEKQALSLNRVTHLGIHLPGMTKNNYVSTALPVHIWPTYRGSGPRKAHMGDHTGLNAYLLRLLQKLNPDIQRITGNVADIESVSGHPVAHLKEADQALTGDLIILANGVSRGSITINGLELAPNTIPTYIEEIAVIDGPEADILYGKERNIAHVVIGSHESPFHYGFFLPQKVRINDPQDGMVEQTLVTFACFGSSSDPYMDHQAVNAFLKTSAIDFFPGADQESILCRCNSWIPSTPANIESLITLASQSILVLGDAAGTLKLLKNGIGTGIEQGKALARSLVQQGISPEALREAINHSYREYTYDNQTFGQPLLDFVDQVFSYTRLRPILNLALQIEQYLPAKLQIVLPAIAKAATGAASYQEIMEEIQGGTKGRMLQLALAALGLPQLPKT